MSYINHIHKSYSVIFLQLHGLKNDNGDDRQLLRNNNIMRVSVYHAQFATGAFMFKITHCF